MNSDIAAWLELLYGREPAGLIWVGGHGDGWGGRTFTTVTDAADYAARLDASAAGGVYHRLTTLRSIEKGRGTAADSAYLPGFAMDLDLRGPGHKSDRYPETEEDLTTLLRKAVLPEPTVWVHSGGGRYPYWLLDQPADLTLPGALEDAAKFSRLLHETVMAWAADAGWKVDNTSDLARVYRLPGTHNRKTGSKLLARMLGEVGARYALGDITIGPRPAEIDPGPPQHPPRDAANLKNPSGDSSPSSLFGGTREPDGSRGARASVSYTLADAMRFVSQALDRLRSASDGEINNRLNDAAMAMAHFGEEFWSREAAEKQLYSALDATVYDGLTWLASDTIASAYRAMAARGAAGDAECWDAVLLTDWTAAPGGVVQGDEVDALLAEMLTPSVLRERIPPRYMVKGLLSYDSETWLIGGPGSKKSFVALDMAAHVALDRMWQGHRVNRGVAILIVGEGAGSIGKRIKAWESQYGQMPDGGIRVLPRPVQAGDPGAWAVLVKAVERIRAETDPELGMFIVVDTQARSTVGLDENSAKEMGVYVDALAALRVAGRACVLSVHHTTKTGSSTRGSGAQDGAQYSRLLMKSEKGSLVSHLISDKQKDLEEEDPIELRFHKMPVGVDEDGEPIDSLVLTPRDKWTAGEVDGETLDNAAREQNADATRILSTPGKWTERYFKWEKQDLARRILQALAEIGGEHGRTEASLRKSVVETWYPQGEGRTAGKLRIDTTESGWGLAWKQCRELIDDGESVVINTSGLRFSLNPLVLVTDE